MNTLSRICAMVLAMLMLVGLCACKPGTATTTTTVGEDTTTTVVTEPTDPNGEVTEPSEDEPTEPSEDEVTEPSEDEVTEPSEEKTTTTKAPTTVTTTTKVTTTTGTDPWVGATRPSRTKKPTTTTTVEVTEAVTTTTVNYTNTLASIHHDEKYVNEHGIYHVLKGYCAGTVYKTSEWLPVVGYVKDDAIVDALYTATTIMPSPNNMYGSDFASKRKWDTWREHTYKNLDTLNEAAALVQQALELKEHKIKVFLTLSRPTPDHHSNWGELNGVYMSAADNEQRFQMIKYMIDSYVSEMAEKTYNNIDFAGFYWFDEFIEKDDLEWYNRVTDYVRSLGKLTIISPYYKANGWDLCDEAGFDLHSMQSNYFPTGLIGSMNCGSDKRLPANAALINEGLIGGIEMELDSTNHKDAITGWKKTMYVGVESGIVNGYHIHYMGGGPRSVYTLSKASDPYFRSCYDELYKYMHNTLTLEEIWLEPIEKEQGYLENDPIKHPDWV